jgi:ethanolamine utilization microcompartment shell protein EutL
MSKPENQDRSALRRVTRRSQELVAARGIGIGVALGLLVWAALLTVWMI